MRKIVFNLGLFLVLNFTVIFSVSAQSDPVLSSAKAFFEEFVEMSHAFDASLIDFYADDAVIVNNRKNLYGQEQQMSLTGSQYKDMLRKTFFVAKQRGDVSTFSDVTYEYEDEGVRINAVRYSVLKGYDSPYSMLIYPDEQSGTWVIYEEIVNTQ